MQRNSAKNPDNFFIENHTHERTNLRLRFFAANYWATNTHIHTTHTHLHTHTHTHTHTNTLVPHTISNVVVAEMDDKGIKYGNEHS
jgi:hypothetical protein